MGIDDPVAWFEIVDPKVIDWWLAWYTLQNEKTERKMSSPDDVLENLNRRMSHA